MRAFLYWLRNPEVLGPPACPLFRRWTIYGDGEWGLISRFGPFKGKVVIHYFYPNTEDADPHDHPWPFCTLVLKGGYLDLVPCRRCDGRRYVGDVKCAGCRGRGVEAGDHMKRGVFRRRGAGHRHITKVSSAGAWTLCVMGAKEKVWGFWRFGKRYQWEDYEREFGLSFRCDSEGNRVVEVRAPEGRAKEER